MNRLKTVLDCLNIKKAISIDDAYDATSKWKGGTITIDEFLAEYGDAFLPEENEEIQNTDCISFSELLLSGDISSELKAKIQNVLPEYDDVTDGESLALLHKVFSDTNIEFQRLDRIEGFSLSDSMDSIVFLDKEIDNKNVIADFLSSLDNPFEYRENKKIIVIILTKDVSLSEGESTWCTRKEYLVSECGVDPLFAEKLAYCTLFLSKKRMIELKDDLKQACQYVSETMLQCISGFCVVKLLDSYSDWASKANDTLRTLSRSLDFNSVKNLYYNMLKEGDDNFYRILFSIHNLLHSQSYKDNNAQIIQYILCMKRIARITQEENEYDYAANAFINIYNQFDWLRFQFIDDTINLSFSDVAFGDVFELEDKKSKEIGVHYGFILTPPCDCILRQSKTKTSRKADSFALLVFEEKRVSLKLLKHQCEMDSKGEPYNWNDRIRDLRDNSIVIDTYSDSGDSGLVCVDLLHYSYLIQVDSLVMDLTSLDDNGRSLVLDRTRVDERIASSKTHIWQCETFSFHGKMNSLRTILEDSTIPPDEKEKRLKARYGIAFSCDTNSFSIKRIGRLDNNLAELMCSKFASSVYRTGKNSLLSLGFGYSD